MNERPVPSTHAERGAVLVETALVVGIILTMLLFSIQIGVLGFLQITADAASFVDARLAAVSVAGGTTHQAATSAIFPQIAPAQITSTVAPAPSPSVPVDYGYNSADPAEQSASATHRNGGVSMMEPTLQTSTVTKPNIFSLFGKNVGVASQSIDALWLECGIHSNVSNSSSGCSPAAGSTFQGNYFTAGENTPPYFVGFDFLHHCTDGQPWATCSSSGGNFMALGVSEYLHASAGAQDGNWDNPQPGVGGTAGTSTFSLMACHQRVYAGIATALAQYPTLDVYYDATDPNVFGWPNAEVIYYQLYAYDGSWPNAGGTRTRTGFNNFAYGAIGYPAIFDFDGPYGPIDTSVGEVYQWDTTVQAGSQPGGAIAVGSNPTYPGKSCP